MVKLPKQFKLVGIIWLTYDTLKEFFKILVLEAEKGNLFWKKKIKFVQVYFWGELCGLFFNCFNIFDPLIPGGNKSSHILTQACS